MTHPLLLLILLVGSLVFYSWYKRAPAGQKRQILVIGAVALALVLLVTGRLNPLLAGLVALVPLAYRAFGLVQALNTAKLFKNQFKAGQGPSQGQKSRVETRFLRMELDHDSGAMDGEILEGRDRGSRLSAHGLESLLALLQEWQRADEQSASLLAAYLDRTHGDAWRDAYTEPSQRAAQSGAMSRAEALSILGLEEGAGRDDVVAAHRRLMQRLHPDRGGSDYLAAKINNAKDVLLDSA